MGSQSEVMHWYEQIAPLTERMLLMARAGQWGGLPELEAQYSAAVDRLRVIEPLEILSGEQTSRKAHLLVRLKANHEGICRLLAPQLARLGAVLRSIEAQQNLHLAYRQTDDANL